MSKSNLSLAGAKEIQAPVYLSKQWKTQVPGPSQDLDMVSIPELAKSH